MSVLCKDCASWWHTWFLMLQPGLSLDLGHTPLPCMLYGLTVIWGCCERFLSAFCTNHPEEKLLILFCCLIREVNYSGSSLLCSTLISLPPCSELLVMDSMPLLLVYLMLLHFQILYAWIKYGIIFIIKNIHTGDCLLCCHITCFSEDLNYFL